MRKTADWQSSRPNNKTKITRKHYFSLYAQALIYARQAKILFPIFYVSFKKGPALYC
jgi:hypothetical protein